MLVASGGLNGHRGRDPGARPHCTGGPRLYQRAYRRRNTQQHSRIYDELGLAPTVSTTSAVYVWHDGTQARLLQARELARLQGLPDRLVLPEGRVVATRLIGNAVPPALIRALLF